MTDAMCGYNQLPERVNFVRRKQELFRVGPSYRLKKNDVWFVDPYEFYSLVPFPNNPQKGVMRRWLNKNCKRLWLYDWNVEFELEDDAMFFKLRWG